MARMPCYAKRELFNHFRAADWRWRRAQRIVAERLHASRCTDDPQTLAAARYCQVLHGGRGHGSLRMAAMTAAHRLADSDSPSKWEIQARILAGQQDDDIAAACQVPADVVYWFEALFFDVRQHLTASDWVAARVIGPGLWVGFPSEEMGRIWMAFGYFAGVDVVAVVLAETLGRPMPGRIMAVCSGDPVLYEARLRRSVRLAVAAMMLPVDIPVQQLVDLRVQVAQTQKVLRPVAVGGNKLQEMIDAVVVEQVQVPTPARAPSAVVA